MKYLTIILALILAGCATGNTRPPSAEHGMAGMCGPDRQVICEQGTGRSGRDEKCFCAPRKAIDELFEDPEDQW